MDEEALDRLARRVDSKTGTDVVERRTLSRDSDTAPRTWEDMTHKRSRISKLLMSVSPLEILFTLALIFFVGAAAVASLLVFSGDNTVSTKNVGIVVTGPNTVRAGDVVTMQVIVTNQNAVPMNLTDMLVEFPVGTRSDADVTVDLPRVRLTLGTIKPGESVNRTVKAVIFGQAGTPADTKVTVEYRVPSSNAVFHSGATYHATVSQSPASITIESLSEVVSGQATDITVHVASNATEVLSGMLLNIDYPPGFALQSADPAPRAGSTVWDLGDIEPGGERSITLHGTFTGEDGDDRVVHFTAGTKKKNDPVSIAAPLAATDITLKVSKPFVSVALALNNSLTSPISTKRGETIRAEVRWANNLPVKVQNLEIQVKLNGAVLDKSSVKAGQGFYRSVDSTMLFNKDTDKRLAEVDPGVTGVSTFQFNTLPQGQGAFQAPQITLSATVSARRPIEGGVPENVTSSASGQVVVETDLAVATTLAKVVGPLPPKVDSETVYAVTWTINNSANAIADANVSAAIPNGVVWKNQSSSPDVTYNETTHLVTWAVGDMQAGQTKNATFQVGLTPSIVQINHIPQLLTNVTLNAFDRFVRAQIQRLSGDITTQTSLSIQQATVVP